MQDSAVLAVKVAMPMNQASPAVRVIIEVSRGGFIKRHPDGVVDFVSPLPCPFNYGSVCGPEAADGDPQDAVVLGPPLAAGSEHLVTPWERARFLDDGLVDDKWICGVTPPTEEERKRIHRFFTRYAWAKRMLNRARGRRGCTRFDGLAPLDLG
jgi:inorganic pyrophosphatase